MAESRGDFFAVERSTWTKALDLGLNAAISYLIIARGTGRDNRTSSWSANAVEKYTAISRARAKAAIETLIKNGVIRVKASGSRPRYELAVSESGSPAWTWLPNSLVDGVAGNVAPPLELIRQSQDANALKLLVALYAAHDLESNGGVHWWALCETYDRHEIAKRGGYVIAGFTSKGQTCLPAKPPASEFTFRSKHYPEVNRVFWDALNVLVNRGLVEFIPYLVEGPGPEAELIMPLGWGAGTPAEMALATAAQQAAARLLGPDGDAIVEREGGLVVPLRAHHKQAQAVGICRLLYRPRTAATASWMARENEWLAMAASFDALAPGFEAVRRAG